MFVIVIVAMPPMRGVLLETGNISETIVAKMVIVSIMATPESQPRFEVFFSVDTFIFERVPN